MLKHISAAAAGMALASVLAACGSVLPSAVSGAGPAGGSGSPSLPAAAATVHLAASFSPAALRLRTGQQFIVVVSGHVRGTGGPFPKACGAGSGQLIAGGLVSVQCLGSGRYRYTARRASSVTLTANCCPVRSSCDLDLR